MSLTEQEREQISELARRDLDAVMGQLVAVTTPENIVTAMANAIEDGLDHTPQPDHALRRCEAVAVLRQFVQRKGDALAI